MVEGSLQRGRIMVDGSLQGGRIMIVGAWRLGRMVEGSLEVWSDNG